MTGPGFRHRMIASGFALLLGLSAGGYLSPVHAGESLPEPARILERVIGLPGLTNVGKVAPGIYRGGQPVRAGYETLRRMGIRTVLNLRSRHDERADVESAGIRYRAIPFPLPGPVDDRIVRDAVAFLREPGNRPVYVHCQAGSDRTGVVVAVYRMEVEGWTRSQAVEEMQAYGFHDLWMGLMEYVLRYRPGGGAPPVPAEGR